MPLSFIGHIATGSVLCAGIYSTVVGSKSCTDCSAIEELIRVPPSALPIAANTKCAPVAPSAHARVRHAWGGARWPTPTELWPLRSSRAWEGGWSECKNVRWFAVVRANRRSAT